MDGGVPAATHRGVVSRVDCTAFATKSYHGHRGVSPTMDRIIEELASHKRLKAVEKGRELLNRDRERVRARERGEGGVPDLKRIDPTKLIGLTIRKDFDGFGLCKGVIRSTDKELVTNRVMFGIEYADGDVEDIYLDDITQYVRADEVVLHVQ